MRCNLVCGLSDCSSYQCTSEIRSICQWEPPVKRQPRREHTYSTSNPTRVKDPAGIPRRNPRFSCGRSRRQHKEERPQAHDLERIREVGLVQVDAQCVMVYGLRTGALVYYRCNSCRVACRTEPSNGHPPPNLQTRRNRRTRRLISVHEYVISRVTHISFSAAFLHQ